MNQKRSWPGVPNRYSTRLGLMVRRPKSIATVVVRLRDSPLRLSWPTLALDSVSSVSSGRTSLMAPTMVVLPAPKPPAMRILNAANGMPSPGPSEGAEPMQHLLQQVGAGLPACLPLGHHLDPALRDEIGHQHPNHPDRQADGRRHIRHGGRRPAQPENPAVLRA